MFSGCNDTSALDAEIRKNIIGMWIQCSGEDDLYNEDGSFYIYQFTTSDTRAHLVSENEFSSWTLNKYEIIGGKYKAILETGAEFAKIEFRDGHMFWISDDSANEFRQLTDEEKQKYGLNGLEE